MQRSSELEAWARELFSSTDPRTIADAHSKTDDVLVIGTDESEWVEGGEAVGRAFEAQASTTVEVKDLRCYEEGSVSWMAGRIEFVLPNGNRLPARVTGVAHKEDGSWKIVQSHASVGRDT